jgi:hypothetical protein
MTGHDLLRRAVMRGALKGAAYSVPLIVSASIARKVYAVSSAPLSAGSVAFTPSGSVYVGQGNGAVPNTPFLFLLSDADGNVLANKVVPADSAGRFTVSLARSGYTVGVAATPTLITASQGPPTILPPGVGPTPTPGRIPCLPGQVCDPTAIAQTAVARTATARAKGP